MLIIFFSINLVVVKILFKIKNIGFRFKIGYKLKPEGENEEEIKLKWAKVVGRSAQSYYVVVSCWKTIPCALKLHLQTPRDLNTHMPCLVLYLALSLCRRRLYIPICICLQICTRIHTHIYRSMHRRPCADHSCVHITRTSS